MKLATKKEVTSFINKLGEKSVYEGKTKTLHTSAKLDIVNGRFPKLPFTVDNNIEDKHLLPRDLQATFNKRTRLT